MPRIKHITKLAYKIPRKDGALITRSHEPKDIEGSFRRKEFFAMVAILDGKIVGAVRYKFLEGNDLYFYKLAVLKTYRNKKIGALLLNKIEVEAEKKGVAKILLDCAQEKKLSEYYKKFGYKIDKIKKHHDHHDVFMSKKIK